MNKKKFFLEVGRLVIAAFTTQLPAVIRNNLFKTFDNTLYLDACEYVLRTLTLVLFFYYVIKRSIDLFSKH